MLLVAGPALAADDMMSSSDTMANGSDNSAMASPDASAPQTPADKFSAKLHDILQSLDLSAEQQTAIHNVLEEAKANAQALRQQLADTPPAQQAQRRGEFLARLHHQIDQELTADQQKQFDQQWAGAVAQLRQPAAAPKAAQAGSTGAAAGAGGANAAANAAGQRLGGGGGGPAVQRLRTALAQLDLNEDQRSKVDTLLNETAKKVRAAMAATPTDRRTEIRQIVQQVRDQLRDILEPDQLQALGQQLQQMRQQNRNGAAGTPPTAAPPPAATTAAGAVPADLAMPLAAGEPAPPFKLDDLNGSSVSSASLHGRLVVLVFGSYSSPTFRDRAADLEKLWRHLDNLGDRYDGPTPRLYVVYTREAHPTGGWEVDRNKQDHVSVPIAADQEQRSAEARRCREALHLTVPFLVDGMDDAVTNAYHAFPDGAVVIGRDGNVVGSLRWAEPAALQRMVDAALVPAGGSASGSASALVD